MGRLAMDSMFGLAKLSFFRYCLVMLLSSSFQLIASTAKIPTIQQAVELDGILDESVWQQAQMFQLNNITYPYENQAAPVDTQVFVYQSTDTLYVGFVAKDPNPEAIRGYLRDRDKVWEDDLVGFRLDTYGTQKIAYQFYVNPLGVQIDSVESEINNSNKDDWDTVWYAQTTVDDSGYTVEIAIPLDKLNYDSTGDANQWSVEFIRWYPREVRYRLSHLTIDFDNACSLCQLLVVDVGNNNIQSDNISVTPSLVATSANSRSQDNDWNNENQFDAGLDLNWRITSDDWLSLTLNPDFSQIEDDNAQLSLNNNFSLYFPEKRRFFLENQSYFDSTYQLVHTRNLIAPDHGLKYTKRSNKHTFASLVANDESTHLLVPGNLGSATTSFDEQSQNAAFRYRYDYSNESTFGVTTTFRDSENYHNNVFSFDGKHFFTDSTSVKMQLMASKTKYPEFLAEQLCSGCQSESRLRAESNESLSDYAYQLELNHNSRNWWVKGTYIEHGEDFRADLGFISNIDYRMSRLQTGYVVYPTNSIWNKVEVWSGGSKETNLNGELLGDNIEIQMNAKGAYQSTVSTGIGTQTEVGLRMDQSNLSITGNAPEFDLDFWFFYGDMRPSSQLFVSTLIRIGDTIDYANNRKASQVRWQPIIQWDVNDRMYLKTTFTFENLESGGLSLYFARLLDFRASYQFNNASKIRMSLIYDNTTFNPENYPFEISPTFKRLSAQLVYSYRFNALSTFYLGYAGNGDKRGNVTQLREKNRDWFAKLSYSF